VTHKRRCNSCRASLRYRRDALDLEEPSQYGYTNGVDMVVSARSCSGGLYLLFYTKVMATMPSGPVSAGGKPFRQGDALFLGTKQMQGPKSCIRTFGTNTAHHPASQYIVLLSPEADVKGKSWLFCSVLNTSDFLSSRECKYNATTPWAQGLCFLQVCTMAIALWAPLRLVPCSFVHMGH